MKDYRFEERDEVAHVENLKQKMFVIEIKRRIVQVNSPTGERDSEGKLKKVEKRKIDGIEVYWWAIKDDGNKEYKTQKFHTDLIVPWSVAQDGKDAVNKWIEEKCKVKSIYQ